MNNDFIPFELAVKLKEKGFNEPCYKYYQRGVLNGDGCWNRYNRGTADRCSAPTISQVLKWLRKENKVHIGFGYSPRKKWRYVVMYMDDRFYNKPTLAVDGFLNIEQAALVGIEYVIDNLI